MATRKIEGFVRIMAEKCHMCDSGLPLDRDGIHEDRFGEKARCEKLIRQGVYMVLTSPSSATGEVPATLVIGETAFTKSEVEALLSIVQRRIIEQHMETGTERLTNDALHRIEAFFIKHGLTPSST